jgi:REP-associated tyrosine transposase
MSHTYVSNLVHVVFSTKERRNLITPDKQAKLWAYLGGIARNNAFKAVAKAVQLLKGGSSKWMNENCVGRFAWQEGYGAFTVGISQRAHTVAYINSQAEHHRKRSFEEEFVVFLQKHGIEYDPKYVWG